MHQIGTVVAIVLEQGAEPFPHELLDPAVRGGPAHRVRQGAVVAVHEYHVVLAVQVVTHGLGASPFARRDVRRRGARELSERGEQEHLRLRRLVVGPDDDRAHRLEPVTQGQMHSPSACADIADFGTERLSSLRSRRLGVQ
ncbi:hypothetical protein [Nocardia gipuzkoensis]